MADVQWYGYVSFFSRCLILFPLGSENPTHTFFLRDYTLFVFLTLTFSPTFPT